MGLPQFVCHLKADQVQFIQLVGVLCDHFDCIGTHLTLQLYHLRCAYLIWGQQCHQLSCPACLHI